MTELPNQKEGWEKELLEKVVLSTLREQRRTRLWSIFFRSLAFAYLFILLFWEWAYLAMMLPVRRIVTLH